MTVQIYPFGPMYQDVEAFGRVADDWKTLNEALDSEYLHSETRVLLLTTYRGKGSL